MVKAFGIEGTAHIANQLLAHTGRLKGANLCPQALINHGARGIETHASQLFAQLTRYSKGGVNTVVIKVNQSNASDGRVHIFVKGRGCCHSVAVIGSNQSVGDGTQSLACTSLSIGIGGKAVDAANFSSIAIGFLCLINIIAGREEQHGLAVSSLHNPAHISSNTTLTRQNTKINGL